MLLKSKWVTKLIEEEILKNMELNENEDETIQSLRDATSGVLWEKFSEKGLLQKIKISNKKSNFTTKGDRKREKTKSKFTGRNEIIKISPKTKETKKQ